MYDSLVKKELVNIEGQRWRVVAILVNKKPICITSNNLNKTHPQIFKLNPLKRLHAEFRCIKKSPTGKLKNGILYVLRFNSNDELCLAKPCKMCMSFIKSAGIKKIIYSNNYSELEQIMVV